MKENIAKLVSGFITITLIMQLCACQKKPNEVVVSSNENGVFDANVVKSAIEEDTLDAVQSVELTDDFYSSDGSVHFMLNLATSTQMSILPVVEVVPHYLTAEEAKRVASVLFGDVDFFEADPLLAPQYTKEEILESIKRWSNYTNSDAISLLLGQDDEFTIERVKAKIEELNALYESAQDESSRMPCQWKFYKDSFYTYSPQEVKSKDTSFDNDAIMATCEIHGIRYRYNVVTRNKADYKLNMISAYFDSGKSPMSIDENIYRASLTRTSPPTEDQIESVKSAAMDMLQRMELGEWMIDQCYVRTLGETVLEHVICIDAVPLINKVAAVRLPQLAGLTSNGTYSSNYYRTEVNFEFSADGDLIKFTMYSPIDVKQIVYENVATIDIDTLLENAKQHLALSDSHQYGLQDVYGVLTEELDTSVDICKLNYGLLREKVPDTDDSYYYFPGIVLYGTVENTGLKSGQLYFKSEEPFPIIALNAVDGTVVAFANE